MAKEKGRKIELFKQLSALFVLMFVVVGSLGLFSPHIKRVAAVAPPNIISYQGRLLNANGAPVSDASLSMEFRVFDAASGGTCLWSNSSSDCDSDTPASTVARTVTLTDGLFSENLGDTTLASPYAAIPDSVFADNAGVYLEVEIAGETLSPRKRIVASGYAQNANSLDGLDSADFLAAAGDTATGDFDFTGAEFLGASPFVFEGASNDGNTTTFAFTEPTGTRTITFKDESGTVAYLSDIGGAANLDDAYDNYGATASIINIDAAEGQTGGLVFSVDGADNLTIDLQSTGDYVVQNASGDFYTLTDAGAYTLSTASNATFTVDNVILKADTDVNVRAANDFDLLVDNDIDFYATGAGSFFAETGSLILGADNLSNSSVLTLGSTGNTSLVTGIGGQVQIDTETFRLRNEASQNLLTVDGTASTGVFAFNGRVESEAHANGIGLQIPTSAGVPSGVTDTAEGDIVWDSTGNAFYVYDGSAFTEIGGGATTNLDDAYNNYGATASIINIDAAQGQTGGLEFSVNGTDNFIVDLQSTGDFVLQDGGSDILTLQDDGDLIFDAGLSNGIIALVDLSAGNRSQDVVQLSIPNNVTNSFTGQLLELTLSDTSSSGDAFYVTNDGTGSSVFIDQNGDTGAGISDVSGGALHITNTGNDGGGLTVFSDNGATQDAPLAYFFVNNTAFDQSAVEINTSGTGYGLYIDPDGSADGLFIDKDGSGGYAANFDQGIDDITLFLDSSATTANVLDINTIAATSGNLIDLSSGGTTATAQAIYIDFDNGDNDNDVFTLVTDETTNSGTSADTVKARITASGEFFSDRGFSAGATTNYYDGSITDNDANADDFFDFNLAAAADSFRVLTGNLVVGNGTPGTVALDGEDLYVEGVSEFNGLINAEGGIFASASSDSLTVDGSGDVDLTANTSITATVDDDSWTLGADQFIVEVNAATLEYDEVSFDVTSQGINFTTSTSDFVTNLTSTGDFILQDNGTDILTFSDAGRLFLQNNSLTTQSLFTLLSNSITTGEIIDASASNSAFAGEVISGTIDQATATGNIFYANNDGTGSSLFIDQDGTTGATVSDAAGGALHISNTNNIDYGLTLYSNTGATANSSLATFVADNSAFDQNVFDIQQDGAADALSISQNGTGNALYIDQNALSSVLIDDTLGGALHVSNTGNNNYALTAYSNNGATQASALAKLFVDNVAFDEPILELENDGVGAALYIDPNNSTGTTVNDTSGGALHINNTSNGDYAFTAYSNNSTVTSGLAFLHADNTSFDQEVLAIQNDGTGSAIFIDQNGDTGATINDTTGGALHISNTGNTGAGLSVYTNEPASVAPLVYIHADTNGFDNPALYVQLDTNDLNVPAVQIDHNFTDSTYNSAAALDIDASTSAHALDILNDGGTASNDGINLQVCQDSNPNSGCNFITFRDGDGDIVGAVEGDGAGGVTNASSGSDYAELFPGTYANFAQGDVLGIDSSGNIKKATNDSEVIGSFSVAPNTLGNWKPDWQALGTYVPVALLGQVPVNVDATGGAISAGDYLTLSSTPGVARKLTGPGYTLGIALEDHVAGSGQIMVYVQPGWHSDETITEVNGENIFMEDFLFAEEGIATSGSQGEASRALTFRGSGWNGISAEDVNITLFADVSNSDQYRLSVHNDLDEEVAFINDEGDLALAGRLFPSDQGSLQTEKYIYYDSTGAPTLDYMRTNAAGWGVGSYDFAEMFPAVDNVVAGEVVVFANGKESIGRANGTPYDQKIAGIVSTRPGFLAGEFIEGHVPIALAGRVPTFVTAENGSIKPGDPLTTSSTPGYAMKATEAGPIVGYAMESHESGSGSIIVYVNVSYYDGGETSEAPAANTQVSGVTSVSTLDVNGGLNLNGGSIASVSSISGINFNWKIDETGNIITNGRVISLVRSYQNENVETYGVTSRETTIQLSGTVQLSNGVAAVNFQDFDEKFNSIISTTTPYRVLLTPNGATNQLYVSNRENGGFTIREVDGSSDVLVDWLVIATHKDFEPEESPISNEEQEGVTEEEQPQEETSTNEENGNVEESSDEGTSNTEGSDEVLEETSGEEPASTEGTETPPEETVEEGDSTPSSSNENNLVDEPVTTEANS